MNSYANMESWKRQSIRKQIDSVLFARFGGLPVSETNPLHHGGKRRSVIVTRYSSRPTDELSVDLIGGKIVIDCLVRAAVLAGDSAQLLGRDARWVKSPPGTGKLVVEVLG